jgi:5-methylcytosine-specific restriction protein B
MSHADDVREYCIAKYVEPARENKQKYVKIRSGDVHNALNYQNRYPLVCAALGTDRFEQLARVSRVAIDGPLNGANTEFTFKLD